MITKQGFHSFDHVGIYLLNHVFGHGHIEIAMTKGSNSQNVGGLSADVKHEVNVSQMRKHEKVCVCVCVRARARARARVYIYSLE